MRNKVDYEHGLDYKKVDLSPSTLGGFMEEPEEIDEIELWKKEWVGMPEYEEGEYVYKSIRVHFNNEQDYLEFCNLIGQPNMTLKTKSIWHPAQVRGKNSLFRWIDEEQEDQQA